VEPWIVIVIVVGLAVLFYIAQHFGWIDLSNKSKTSGSKGGSALGIGDEVFHPTRHEAQVELDRQTVLPAPAPLPGDGDAGSGRAGIYDGQVRIDLNKNGKHSAG
jgi:hypothetical protein